MAEAYSKAKLVLAYDKVLEKFNQTVPISNSNQCSRVSSYRYEENQKVLAYALGCQADTLIKFEFNYNEWVITKPLNHL